MAGPFKSRKDDTLIACIGLPGSGKSTLIDSIVGGPTRARSNLDAINTTIEPTRHQHPWLKTDSLVILEVGTDGDDLDDIIPAIETWIIAMYGKKGRLSGVLLVHSLLQRRVRAMSDLMLNWLEKALEAGGVIIVKTHVRHGTCEAREARLEGLHWDRLISNGAFPMRFDKGDPYHAASILVEVLSKYSRGNHLKRIFDAMSARFRNSKVGCRISQEIDALDKREKACMEQLPPHDSHQKRSVPASLLDSLHALEQDIFAMHKRLSERKSSWAEKLFARFFG